MDTSNGRIYTPEQLKYLRETMWKAGMEAEAFGDRFREMMLPPTAKQMARRPPKVGRNEPCPCGSGKKFKRCCLNPVIPEGQLVSQSTCLPDRQADHPGAQRP